MRRERAVAGSAMHPAISCFISHIIGLLSLLTFVHTHTPTHTHTHIHIPYIVTVYIHKYSYPPPLPTYMYIYIYILKMYAMLTCKILYTYLFYTHVFSQNRCNLHVQARLLEFRHRRASHRENICRVERARFAAHTALHPYGVYI